MTTVHAIIVTYHPDPAQLDRLLSALAPQVQGGIVVNNGSHQPLPKAALQSRGFDLLSLDGNRGIAAALNAGFDWALGQGAEFVITFDQDSEPAPDMVATMVQAWRGLTRQGIKIGAMGPQQHDRRSAQYAAFLAPIRWRRCTVTPSAGQVVEVDHLITSGCLTTVDVWRAVGPFREDFFIDYVDIEWNLRQRAAGYRLYGLGGAVLHHAVGDEVHNWRGQHIPHHSPLRHYYLLRNGAHLQKLAHIPLAWKVSDAIHLLKVFVYFSLTGRPRRAHVVAMARGVWDGWRNRLGPARETDPS